MVLISNLTSAAVIADCSAPIEGTLGSNLIRVVEDIFDKETCDKLCQDEETCSVYTYHSASNPASPETCYLLTAIREPVSECLGGTCETGLPNCEGKVCAFVVDGAMFPMGVKMTEGEKDVELLRLGACPSPVAIAIGGGGTREGRDSTDFKNLHKNPFKRLYHKIGKEDIIFGMISVMPALNCNCNPAPLAEEEADMSVTRWASGPRAMSRFGPTLGPAEKSLTL